MTTTEERLKAFAARVAAEPYRWRMLGRHFGYPECCIDFFCDKWAHKLSRIPAVHDAYVEIIDRLHVKDGYIPCPACLTKLAAGGSCDAQGEPAMVDIGRDS